MPNHYVLMEVVNAFTETRARVYYTVNVASGNAAVTAAATQAAIDFPTERRTIVGVSLSAPSDGDAISASVLTAARLSAFSPNLHPGYVPGYWYQTAETVTALGTPSDNTLYLYPFTIHHAVSISGLGWKVTTAGTGSGNKGAIWRSVAGRPSGLPVLSQNTAVATTSTDGQGGTADATVLFTPGTYWIGTAVDTGSGGATMLGIAITDGAFCSRVGGSTIDVAAGAATTNAQMLGLSIAFTYGDNIAEDDLTAASFTEVSTTAVIPCVFIGIAS